MVFNDVEWEWSYLGCLIGYMSETHPEHNCYELPCFPPKLTFGYHGPSKPILNEYVKNKVWRQTPAKVKTIFLDSFFHKIVKIKVCKGRQVDVGEHSVNLRSICGPTPPGAVQSRADPATSAYSSIYLAFCNSQCRKWNSEKCIFVRNFAVVGNLIDSLVQHNGQPHTWQRTFGTKEKGNLKAHASQQGTTIVETGKLPFGALAGLLNIHINNQWSRL